MANKSVYQSFDTTALNYYDLAGAPLIGVLVGSVVEDVLCTQDQTTYEKITRSLSVPTESGSTFVTKKKAFILPRCKVSQDRLKAALKEHGIIVTNDYTKADLIVGHEGIEKRFENAEPIMTSIMLAKLWNYETTDGATSSLTSFSTNPINQLIKKHGNVILTSKITENIRYYNFNIINSLYDEWMITGMALNLAHIIDTTEVSVIDAETVLHSSSTKMIMDEELLVDLKKQLNAYGDENKAMAAKIIPCIDYTKNYHLLWQFAQDCENIMWNYNRDKDIQFWLKESNFDKFTRLSAQSMILWLEKKEELCQTTFKYLEPIVRQEIRIENRDLYTFKVSVKKEYLQYLTNKTKTDEEKI